jgi:hypothetical protein
MKPAKLGKDAVGRHRAVVWSALTVVFLSGLAAWAESPKLAWNGQLPGDLTDQQARQLIDKLGDQSFDVREQATSRLIEVGPVALPAVMEGTRSSDPEVMLRSWRIIEEWASLGDVSALLTQLQSRSPAVRAGAADSLSKIEPRPLSAVPGLIEATDDPIDFVRVSARDALKKIQETNGLRIEFNDTAERVEVGTEPVFRIDVTNCGKEPVEQIRLVARAPAQLIITAAQGSNRPLQHELQPNRVLTEPFRLEPNATLRWEVTTRAAAAGEARFKIELTAAGLPHPLIEEKATPIVAPQPKNEQPKDQ